MDLNELKDVERTWKHLSYGERGAKLSAIGLKLLQFMALLCALLLAFNALPAEATAVVLFVLWVAGVALFLRGGYMERKANRIRVAEAAKEREPIIETPDDR